MINRIPAFLGGLLMQLLRGIGHALADMFRAALYRAGRFLGKLAVWVAGAALLVWIIQTNPEIIGNLLGIAILGWVIWWMVSSLFRKKRKK